VTNQHVGIHSLEYSSVPYVIVDGPHPIPLEPERIRKRKADLFPRYIEALMALPEAALVICEQKYFDSWYIFIFDGVKTQKEAVDLVAGVYSDIYKEIMIMHGDHEESNG